MTDESCGTVYGYAHGTPSKFGQEENEEIEIVLADRVEAKRILKEVSRDLAIFLEAK